MASTLHFILEGVSKVIHKEKEMISGRQDDRNEPSSKNSQRCGMAKGYSPPPQQPNYVQFIEEGYQKISFQYCSHRMTKNMGTVRHDGTHL